MAVTDRYDVLFEPINVGSKTAKNRFWSTPHASGLATEWPSSQAAFRETKAEGGWGVVFTEATSIAPEVDKSPARLSRLWDEGDVRNLRLVVGGIHKHGALAGIELEYHSSIGYMTEGRGLNARGVMPVVGQSGLPVGYAATAGEMDRYDIEEIQQLHVAAALRARDAGFDLLTFHCGHAASLFAHFLIPYYNMRTDEYGGSFENRARFARETMEKIRAAVGDSVALGLRLGVDTLDEPLGLGDRGIRADGDAPRFIEHMDDLVDYWDFVIGGYDWAQDAQSSRTAKENHEARYTRHLKQHTTKPVVNVGRLNSPDTMVEILNAGQCDFIGAARATISDPYLPEKIRSGAIEDIRECIGCNICVSRDVVIGQIQCTQNATVGEEFRRGWHPEVFTKATNSENDVLVIGAGPAGMECAMVLGKRGMRNVHLVDAGKSLGGSLNWITRLPGRNEWRRIIEYRELQLSKLANVTTILDTHLSTDDVLDYGAGIVVVATGSSYSKGGMSPFDRRPLDFLQNLGPERIFTPEEAMAEGATLGQRVMVLDFDGYFVGPGLAEHFAHLGHAVTAVTPANIFGFYMTMTKEYSWLNVDLERLGIEVLTNATAADVVGSTVTIKTRAGLEAREFDAVVVVGQRRADSSLFRELRARQTEWESNEISAVYQIGDCVRPNFIADAIFSGHRLAREIDAADPARPLPFVRERRLIDATEADFAVGARATLPIY